MTLGCVWYVGRDGTERDETFRPAFGAPKMGGTGCSTGQILSVFAFHLPPGTGLFHTNIPHVFFKNYTFVPSRPVPFRPVPSRSVPFRLRTKRTPSEQLLTNKMVQLAPSNKFELFGAVMFLFTPKALPMDQESGPNF
ncbi:hypothetical protein DVH24_016533 [Malus domestica]|uniref:Uncharacterized protein n=1 Tax=Malus domestica TaxID=3750 RepID=A0A498HX07_MALDO|nr:hypothetical protein DVH24_016533 [Malus domestica]